MRANFCAVLILTVLLAYSEAGWAEGTPLAEIKLRNVLDCMTAGRNLYREGKYRRAAMEFEKVLKLDPTSSAAADYLDRCEKGLKNK